MKVLSKVPLALPLLAVALLVAMTSGSTAIRPLGAVVLATAVVFAFVAGTERQALRPWLDLPFAASLGLAACVVRPQGSQRRSHRRPRTFTLTLEDGRTVTIDRLHQKLTAAPADPQPARQTRVHRSPHRALRPRLRLVLRGFPDAAQGE